MNNLTKKKKKSYNHLTLMEREVIHFYLGNKKNQTEIGKELKRHKSTISRELKRNCSPEHKIWYLASRAHSKAYARKKEAHKKIRLKNNRIKRYVENKLKSDWTPEEIAGRLSIDYPNLNTNYESIYLYIYEEAPHLIEYLARQHKKRKKRAKKSKKRHNRIPNRVMIDKRPPKANKRKEIGHWEADCVISRSSKKALQVTNDRKSKYVVISHIPAKTAKETSKAINRRLSRFSKDKRKTITYDNGSENVNHEYVNKVLKVKSYFCHAYHAWEKGTVENTIGLIRRYLPKRTDFANISKEEIKRIEKLLNNRPRKRLAYKTPSEVFYSCCA